MVVLLRLGLYPPIWPDKSGIFCVMRYKARGERGAVWSGPVPAVSALTPTLALLWATLGRSESWH